ncbi:MAG: helix-turn-helix transcriptional regulator [Clostridia bacterium]|nr:helix-turn-helix transcriptional regulator [Clostridia bacterium]
MIALDKSKGYPSNHYPNSDIYCYHDFYEMELFLSGEGTHFLNGTPYLVKPGYLYLLYPGDYHYMQLTTHTAFNLWNLKMSVDAPSAELMAEIRKHPGPYCVYLEEGLLDFLNRELIFLYDCLHNGTWNPAMTKNSAERICTVLLYELERNPCIEYPKVNDQIWKILDYIQKKYSTPITLTELAAIAEMSENYVGIYFKTHTGMRFTDYLNQTRLFHAAMLLKETYLTVKEIAYRVGYGSPEYLTRQFNTAFGTSPTEFRKSAQSCS